MKISMYSLKDVKLERFQPPFLCRNDQEARLIISRAGFNPLVYRDLDIFKVADFDDETGELSLYEPIVRVGTINMEVKDE